MTRAARAGAKTAPTRPEYFTDGPAAGSLTFTTPTNARRNQFYGPGYSDVDLSVFKDGRIGERVSAQFRVEMFNLLNSINLAPPDSTWSGGAAFGTVTQTSASTTAGPASRSTHSLPLRSSSKRKTRSTQCYASNPS